MSIHVSGSRFVDSCCERKLIFRPKNGSGNGQWTSSQRRVGREKENAGKGGSRSTPSPAGIAQANWNFVETLLKVGT